jgi:hypothetical protein
MRPLYLFCLLTSQLTHALIVPLEVRDVVTLSVAQFKAEYVDQMKPVVLRHLEASEEWSAMQKWGPEYIKETCGRCPVSTVVKGVKDEQGWGGFDFRQSQETTFEDLFSSWKREAFSGSRKSLKYGFDINVKCLCPSLMDDFGVLKYFLSDTLMKWTSLYFDTVWPMILLGPPTTGSGIHVDNSFLPFWLTLIAGKKQFRVIMQQEWSTHLSAYFGDGINYGWEGPSNGMKIPFDVFDDEFLSQNPDFDDVQVWDTTLLPGDTIYIPSGAAHGALNLFVSQDGTYDETQDVAIGMTSNYLDRWHAPQIAELFCEKIVAASGNDEILAIKKECLFFTGIANDTFPADPLDIPLSVPFFNHFLGSDLCTMYGTQQCKGVYDRCQARNLVVERKTGQKTASCRREVLQAIDDAASSGAESKAMSDNFLSKDLDGDGVISKVEQRLYTYHIVNERRIEEEGENKRTSFKLMRSKVEEVMATSDEFPDYDGDGSTDCSEYFSRLWWENEL